MEDKNPESGGQGEPLSGEPGEGQEGTVFYKPAEVPEELRPTFRHMLAAHTQKQQELASMRKSLEAEKQQLGAAAYKAELFDALSGDERFRAFLETLKDEGSTGTADLAQEDLSGTDFSAMLKKEIDPLRSEIQTLKQAAALAQERQQFLQNHPDFNLDEYRDDMEAAWKGNPNLTMEDAYQIAWARKAQRSQAVQRKQAETSQRKQALLDNAPEFVDSAADVRKSMQVKSFRDAVNKTLSELGWTQREFHGR